MLLSVILMMIGEPRRASVAEEHLKKRKEIVSLQRLILIALEVLNETGSAAITKRGQFLNSQACRGSLRAPLPGRQPQRLLADDPRCRLILIHRNSTTLTYCSQ